MSTDFLEYNLNDWNLLLSKVLTHYRQTLQWEILLHEISGEDEDEYRVDEAGNSTGEVSVSLGHSGKEDVAMGIGLHRRLGDDLYMAARNRANALNCAALQKF